MVVLPSGWFVMGAAENERQVSGYAAQIPQHTLTIAKVFAVSKNELTFADWDACVAGAGCNGYKPNDDGDAVGSRSFT